MHLSILAAFQGLGMTVGPGIQAALTPLKCSPSNEDDFPYFSVDMFSSAGSEHLKFNKLLLFYYY